MMNASGKSTVPASAVHVGGALAALAMLAAFGLLVVSPVEAKRAHASQRLQELDAQRSALARADGEIAATRAEIARLRESLGQAVQLQPATQVNRRIRDITQAATSAGVTVLDVTPSEQRSESRDYGVVAIRLTGSGAFADVVNFLDHHTSDFRDIAVRGMSIQRIATGEDASRVHVSLEFAWFTLPADASTGDAGRASSTAGAGDTDGAGAR